MNAMNQIGTSDQTLRSAVELGASVLAARMGVAGYEPALSGLCHITQADAAFMVRQGGDRRPTVLCAVGKDQNSGSDAALKTLLARHTAQNAAIWSAPLENGRLWCLPLGQTGQHMFTIALMADEFVAADHLLALGEAARAAWQLGANQQKTSHRSDSTHLAPDILGPENPYGLTQAERQVCMHLQAGARPQKIAQDSGKSIATIRTHLARIYSKTNCAGMVEVLHLLGQAPRNEERTSHAN